MYGRSNYKMTTKQAATFIIRGRLDGLNEYTKACRSNKYSGARMKNKNENIVGAALWGNNIGRYNSKVHITFKWYEENKKRDIDNIAFAKKFILDTLVDYEVLQGDSWKYIAGFTDEFYTDKDNPRIEVIIKEV